MRTRSCILVLLALSCRLKQKPQEMAVHRLVATVKSLVPRGSSVDTALATLGEHGIPCSLVRDGTAFGAQYPNYILCPAVDTVVPGQVHTYDIALSVAGEKVTGILVGWSTPASPTTN
jgi:hypothetical protein